MKITKIVSVLMIMYGFSLCILKIAVDILETPTFKFKFPSFFTQWSLGFMFFVFGVLIAYDLHRNKNKMDKK